MSRQDFSKLSMIYTFYRNIYDLIDEVLNIYVII